MKKISAVAFITISCFLLSCSGGKTAAPDSKPPDNTPAVVSTSGGGSISCKLDGKDWSNNSASATQTGKSFLNIASDENQKEAISIIIDHPAMGSFSFNHGVNGSYTDAAGKSFGSKDASGTVVITNYMAPEDKNDGMVEGIFTGNFSFDATNAHIITDGKFSMPVKKL